jgi:ribosomal protein L11 methyltransferase
MNKPKHGPSEGIFSVSLTMPNGLDDDQAACFLACADDESLSTSLVRDMRADGVWRFQFITEIHPTIAELNIRKDLALMMADLDLSVGADWEWAIETIDPETNWLAVSYAALPPFNIGDFFVYGSHYEGTVPANNYGLLIDAATAFGSGEHGTTSGCLEALLQLRNQNFKPKSILDVGTGSGILAIGARKIWPVPTVATDYDPEAVRVAAVHAQTNGLSSDDIHFICAESFDDPNIAAQGPYDLSIANILAPPLKEMAADLVAATAKDGYIILSGILAEQQADEVSAIYQEQGTKEIDRLVRGEWATLLLQKS